MATTEIKTLEKLVKEILEKVKNIGEQKSKENYNEAFDKLNTKLETIDERLATPKSEDNVSAEIISKFDQLNAEIEKNAQNYIQEIQKAFDNYKQNQSEFLSNEDMQNPEIKKFVLDINNELQDIRNQFSKFNAEFTDISLNTSMAVSKEVISLKNHVLALNDSIENVKKEFFENGSFSKLEEIYNTSYNSFKNDVYSILAKITDVSNDALKKIDEFSEELKTFEGLELSIGEILQNQQKEKAEILKIIHNSIEDENKKLLPQIMQLINSISFDESAEEIKDGLYAINENLGIVNQNIETSSSSTKKILGQIDDVSSLVKGDLIDKLSQMNVYLSDVSNDFASLVKGSKGESDTYIYSLLDLESDISRVRVILDELNHTIQDDRSLAQSVTRNISDKIANLNSFVEQTSLLYTSPDYKEILTQFDALNDDITSISKRTNKLILNSDDASEKLQKNIEDFQKILVKICDTVKNFENSSILKTLNLKTDNMHKMLKCSIQSDKAMNEAFIYLANWIDTTSDEIKNIKDSLSLLNKEVQSNIKSEETETTDFAKIEKLLKETNKKIAENTKRIDSVEENLNSISVITTTLEYVSSQVQVINEKLNSNKTLTNKIDKMEKQIQQLLSFVEEE